jgi:hypothetical protein
VSLAPTADAGRVWTFDDLLRLPEDVDWRRFEIIDGALVVSPSPGLLHECVSEDVREALIAVLPAHLGVIGPMAVDLAPSYLIPDLVVVPRALWGSAARKLDRHDVVLAAEVVSPGSVTADRVTKPAQYARAGIPFFWRVETDPVSLTAYLLPHGGSAYSEIGTWQIGETVRLYEPFAVEIDVSRLGTG